MSSITKPFKKAVSAVKKTTGKVVGAVVGGGSTSGGSGSTSNTSSNVTPTTNVTTNTNIDFKDLAAAMKTNSQLDAATQKQLATANQKTAMLEINEDRRQFNELMKLGKYVLGGISAILAWYFYKKKKKKGGKKK